MTENTGLDNDSENIPINSFITSSYGRGRSVYYTLNFDKIVNELNISREVNKKEFDKMISLLKEFT